MRKILLGSILLVGIIALSSCRKKATCSCVSTWNGATTTEEVTYSKSQTPEGRCDELETVENGEKLNDCSPV